ncbi:MAG: ABC transporter ATP-binding protein/permease [Clostridiales Family XIII bacterium]|jgi:ABC-type lipoprotein export system ATPase subunit|nr:ABC transporter ATP-binding protein/permease [Clostridiales Family XIII bacterium]
MLQLSNIRKAYKTGNFTQKALDGVSVAFRDNEFAAVLGPSGSGKTTMLNIIGGLDHYDSGDLAIDTTSTKKYKDRDWDTYRNNRIGFVFQSYNLIPHQTVLANVELALTLSGISKTERRARAKRALEDVGLGEHIHKKPGQLSGGQMQRVAIARALINDPEILLADEPTGALDTQTSKQVMDVLTTVAKDRLVIMVTHNSALAEQYANRIIHLTDGQIVSDSHPFDPAEENQRVGRKARKSSMSFPTAVALSFSNLMTKKGRTFVTALAGSIGIIGVALILALATGINAYIENMEEETLSTYPLSIQSAGFDLSGMFSDLGMSGEGDSESDDSSGVREMKIVETIFSLQSKNDLASLKTYFDDNKRTMDRYVNAIHYSYDITPQIYLADTSTSLDQVNPDSVTAAYGMGSNSGMASLGLGSGSSMMNVFSELPGGLKLHETQYDVLAGHWPENYDEAVLVLSANGKITDYELYAMGLRDRSELKAMIESFTNQTDADIEVGKEGGVYSYDTLMSVGFKIVGPADRYQYDETYDIWVDKSGDKAYMKSLVDKGLALKIVGVVQPDPNAKAASLTPGINYTSGLIAHLMEQAAETEVVKQQLADPAVNVLTGKTFAEEQEDSGSQFDFSKIITVDESALRSAFDFDPSALDFDLSALNIDPSGFNIDLSAIDFDPSSLNIDMPDFDIDMGALIDALAGEVNIPSEAITGITLEILQDFLTDEASKGVTDPAQITADLSDYLSKPETQALIAGRLSQVIDPSALEAQLGKALQGFIQSAVQTSVTQMMGMVQAQIQAQFQQVAQGITAQIQQSMTGATAQIPAALQAAMGKLSAQMGNIDGQAIAQAFRINMGEEEVLELMTSIMNPVESTYERNLTTLGYADPSVPSQISIYPRNFESKKETINILTRYNDRMEKAEEPDKVVRYTDFVGVIMSSVTDIVDLVSYALIAFVSVALVVSSIMIGVITFISVLERKKEIGILRAMGASKQNIRLVFNAETLIIGFVAGVLGVLVTLLLSAIGNIIVFNELGVSQIAQLPPAAAVALVAVSMFLTLIAGLFPASAAARKDPVEALRSE